MALPSGRKGSRMSLTMRAHAFSAMPTRSRRKQDLGAQTPQTGHGAPGTLAQADAILCRTAPLRSWKSKASGKSIFASMFKFLPPTHTHTHRAQGHETPGSASGRSLPNSPNLAESGPQIGRNQADFCRNRPNLRPGWLDWAESDGQISPVARVPTDFPRDSLLWLVLLPERSPSIDQSWGDIDGFGADFDQIWGDVTLKPNSALRSNA